MDKLKALFGTEALTWEQLEEKLKDNKEVKLANLAAGSHISKGKYDELETKYNTANETIKGLKETVSKFDGVDVDGLKKSVTDWETKYNTDIEAVKLESDIFQEVVAKRARNPKIVMAALDRTKIKREGEKIVGLAEQLDDMGASDAYLFETEQKAEGNKQGGAFVFSTGGTHEGGGNTDAFTNALMKGAGLDSSK